MKRRSNHRGTRGPSRFAPTRAVESEQAELRRSDALMRTFIGSLPGAVYRFALDPRWKLDFVSPAMEALTGSPAATFLGLATVAHPDDAPGLRKAIEAAIAGHKPYAV